MNRLKDQCHVAEDLSGLLDDIVLTDDVAVAIGGY